MIFDFDTPIDRRGTHSLKWDRYMDRDILPLWVADMDFASPPAVIEALQTRVAHGVFGYTRRPPSLNETVVEALHSQFGWKVSPEWLVWIPGLVCGLHLAVRSTGKPGDANLVFTPVYPPFLSIPSQCERTLVEVPLSQDPLGQWDIDFALLEECTPMAGAHLLLCNPHNPVGRVFPCHTLERLAEFCLRRKVFLSSDEIHNGLVLDPQVQHTCIASLSSDIAAQSITLMAPSKTYNIPGLAASFAIIPHREVRARFLHTLEGIVPHVNTLGYTATEAAYRSGEAWRKELCAYLWENWKLLQTGIGAIPGLRLSPLQATYLAWIDFRERKLTQPARYLEEYGVGLSEGAEFGLPGFARLNFGCPRSTLIQAIQRIQQAFQ